MVSNRQQLDVGTTHEKRPQAREQRIHGIRPVGFDTCLRGQPGLGLHPVPPGLVVATEAIAQPSALEQRIRTRVRRFLEDRQRFLVLPAASEQPHPQQRDVGGGSG